MLSVVDCIFIGTGFLLCTFMVMLIMLIRSFRRAPVPSTSRSEPMMVGPDTSDWVRQRKEVELEYAVRSPWDSATQYDGFTGIVHVHGVNSGDTFRAVVTDNNSKCRLEKMVRVRG